MAPNESPSPPPWAIGASPTAEQRTFYETYLLREIKRRDDKDALKNGHIREKCQ